MPGETRSHSRAVFSALFVTFLWSTSWVLIKIGLRDIPALTFAGLRYGLAFLCLLPFAFRSGHWAALKRQSAGGWARLILLGVLFYSLTQGAQFVGLAYLPAVTVSLMLNFTTVIVALLGVYLLSERPTALQWAGVILFLGGVLLYFFPVALPAGQAFGMAVVSLGVLANAGSSVLGRWVNRSGEVHPLSVTTVSMGVGAAVLLGAGLGVQGMPKLTPLNWLFIAWLAVVNTAFAFTLWNHSLRTLSAMESSIINGTMLIQIALLAYAFLGERLTVQEIGGMALAGAGALIVQWRRGRGVRARTADDGGPSPAIGDRRAAADAPPESE